jgi:hypothetical protein
MSTKSPDRRKPNVKTKLIRLALANCLVFLITSPVLADSDATSDGKSGDDMGDIAKKLQNPVADLISVPFQNNFDFGGGPDHNGFQYQLKFQPVIPITLCTNWNLPSPQRFASYSPNHRVRRLELKCSLSARNATDGS